MSELTESQALERLMSQSGAMKKARGKPLQLLQRVKANRQDRLFLFGRDDKVMVAPSDDTIQPMLAEFDMGSGVINPAAQLMLDDYAREVKVIQEGGVEEEWQPLAAEPDEYIAPMFPEISWHQHEPFNNNLEFVEVKPTKGLVEKCIVGCPSTALSQLMYYFAKKGWIRGCVAAPDYTSKVIDGYQFKVTGEDARTSFDFANMLDIYTRRKGAKYVDVVTYTPEQAQAVADLCAHVGKAMQMKYSPTGSGQQPEQIADAMENKLHLGHVTIYSQPRDEDVYNTLYLDKVKDALRNGIPVVICGWTGITKTAGGHCFLVEGYRPSDDTYYINWGWGKGFNDGWFKMSLLSYAKKQTSFNFSYMKKFLILDKRPSWAMDVNGDGYINMSDVTKVITDKTGDPMCDVNYDRVVNAKDANAIINKVLGKDIEGGN